MIIKLLTFFGAIALFLYGMNMMSNGLQKIIGKGTRVFLPWLTSDNRLKGVAGGFGITSAMQSSSAATMVVVSYVNAGLIPLKQAVAVIMGANIGTTVTVWLIALLMYACNIGEYAYIVVALGFILSSNKTRSKIHEIGQLIIGVGIMFISLTFVTSSTEFLIGYGNIGSTVEAMSGHGFGSVLIFLVAGLVVAAVSQSSCAAIVLALIMLSMGVLKYDLAVASVLGANIGTTLTASLAAAQANVQARQAAHTHLFFNLFVAILALILFRPFVAMTSWTGSPIFGICLTHTLFNLLGTLALVWFIDTIVTIIFKSSKAEDAKPENEDFRLKYITGRTPASPALSISQAFRETVNFGNVCYEAFSYIPMALNEKNNPEHLEMSRKKLVEFETITDKIELEIAKFLGGLDANELTPEENGEVKILYRVIGELESLGDSGENISRLLERTNVHNIQFDRATVEKLNSMITLVERAYSVMNMNLHSVGTPSFDIKAAYKAEDDINNLRDIYRNEAIGKLETATENYQSINYFLDMLSEFEAMGDFIINISQSLDKQFN